MGNDMYNGEQLAHARARASQYDPIPPEVEAAAETCAERVDHFCECNGNDNCYAGTITDLRALLAAISSVRSAKGGPDV